MSSSHRGGSLMWPYPISKEKLLKKAAAAGTTTTTTQSASSSGGADVPQDSNGADARASASMSSSSGTPQNHGLPTFTNFEIPVAVGSESTAVKLLGGTRNSVGCVIDRDSQFCELYLRPDDPFHHPVFGERHKTSNLLIRVKRTSRPTPSAGSGVTDGSGGDKTTSATSTGSTSYKATILGVISRTYRFEGLADFQFIPSGLPLSIDGLFVNSFLSAISGSSSSSSGNSSSSSTHHNHHAIFRGPESQHRQQQQQQQSITAGSETNDSNESNLMRESNASVSSAATALAVNDGMNETGDSEQQQQGEHQHGHGGGEQREGGSFPWVDIMNGRLNIPPLVFTRVDRPLNYRFRSGAANDNSATSSSVLTIGTKRRAGESSDDDATVAVGGDGGGREEEEKSGGDEKEKKKRAKKSTPSSQKISSTKAPKAKQKRANVGIDGDGEYANNDDDTTDLQSGNEKEDEEEAEDDNDNDDDTEGMDDENEDQQDGNTNGLPSKTAFSLLCAYHVFDPNTPVPSTVLPVPDVSFMSGITLAVLTIKLQRAFVLRPVWTNLALASYLKFEPRLFRFQMPFVAYYMRSGAFRNCWIRLGYDPRTDPNSRIFQTIDIKLSSALTAKLPSTTPGTGSGVVNSMQFAPRRHHNSFTKAEGKSITASNSRSSSSSSSKEQNGDSEGVLHNKGGSGGDEERLTASGSSGSSSSGGGGAGNTPSSSSSTITGATVLHPAAPWMVYCGTLIATRTMVQIIDLAGAQIHRFKKNKKQKKNSNDDDDDDSGGDDDDGGGDDDDTVSVLTGLPAFLEFAGFSLGQGIPYAFEASNNTASALSTTTTSSTNTPATQRVVSAAIGAGGISIPVSSVDMRESLLRFPATTTWNSRSGWISKKVTDSIRAAALKDVTEHILLHSSKAVW